MENRIQITRSLIGAVIASLVGASSAQAGQPTDQTQLQTLPTESQVAAVIAELMNKGHLTVDPKTGELILSSSILSIMKDYDLVQESKLPRDVNAMSSSSSGGCLGPTE